MLAEVGDTLHANVATITDADGISTPVSLQWQVQDFLSGVWLPIVGATGADFKITSFQDGNPLRVKASYVDGKGVTETVVSAPTILVTLPGDVNTPPFVVRAAAAQRHPGHHRAGRPDVRLLRAVDHDLRRRPDAAEQPDLYRDPGGRTRTWPRWACRSRFTVDPTTLVGTGEFKTLAAGSAGSRRRRQHRRRDQRHPRHPWPDRDPGHRHGYRSRACRCRSPTRSSSTCCRSTRRRSRTTTPTRSSRTRPSPSRRPARACWPTTPMPMSATG